MAKIKQEIPPETDPELAEIWTQTGLPKLFYPQPAKIAETRRLHAQGNIRFMKSAFVKEILGNKRRWTEEDRPIPVRDGTTIIVRIYRSTAHMGPRPMMVFGHSSGTCMGGLDTEEFLCQLLCMSLGIVVVSVEYRLAPEWPYPQMVLDIYDAMKWVALNASNIGGALSKGFLSGGVSAGGNNTVMATFLAREEKLQPPLTGHLLICTGMPHHHDGKGGNSFNYFSDRLRTPAGSWEKYKDGPVSTRAMNALYADIGGHQADDPLVTPFSHSDYSNLGPLYYQVAGMDIWKDSAILYSEKVRQAGGLVKMDIYPGVPHLWWSMYPQLSINKKWAKDLVSGVEWLLKHVEARAATSRL